MILNKMVAVIQQVHFAAFDFFLNVILIFDICEYSIKTPDDRQ